MRRNQIGRMPCGVAAEVGRTMDEVRPEAEWRDKVDEIAC